MLFSKISNMPSFLLKVLYNLDSVYSVLCTLYSVLCTLYSVCYISRKHFKSNNTNDCVWGFDLNVDGLCTTCMYCIYIYIYSKHHIHGHGTSQPCIIAVSVYLSFNIPYTGKDFVLTYCTL